MSVLSILFWIVLVLSAIGLFAPAPWPRISGIASLVLFVLIGLQIFRIDL